MRLTADVLHASACVRFEAACFMADRAGRPSGRPDLWARSVNTARSAPLSPDRGWRMYSTCRCSPVTHDDPALNEEPNRMRMRAGCQHGRHHRNGSVCVSCGERDAKPQGRSFPGIHGAFPSRPPGFASLYATLRKHCASSVMIDEDSGEEVRAALKRPFQEADRDAKETRPARRNGNHQKARQSAWPKNLPATLDADRAKKNPPRAKWSARGG